MILFLNPILPNQAFGKTTKNSISTADTFRAAFRDSLISDANSDQKNDLLYPITPIKAVTDTALYSFDSVEDYFLRASHQAPKPEDLYQESAVLRNKAVTLKKFKETPLIIIIPGIFAEFIKNHAFQDVIDDLNNPENIDTKSFRAQAYQDLFNEKYFRARSEMPLSQKYLLSDSRLVLKSMNYENLSDEQAKMIKNSNTFNINLGRSAKDIRELVLLGTLKNRVGDIVANTLTLDTAQLSLESLGSLESNAKTFIRRISKFFSIMGEFPENIILTGYSRGGAIALEMLAQTHGLLSCLAVDTELNLERACIHSDRAKSLEQRRWSDNIRAYVSIAGVIYGSELADVAFPKWLRNDYGNTNKLANDNNSSYEPPNPTLNSLFTLQKPIYLTENKTINAKKISALIKLRNSLEFLNEPSNERSLWASATENPDRCKIPGPICWFIKEGEMIFSNLKADPEKLNLLTANLNAWNQFLLTMAKLSIEGAAIESNDLNQNTVQRFWKGIDLHKFNSEKPFQFGIDILKELFDLALKLENDFTVNAKVDINASIAQGMGLLNEAFGARNYNSNILRFKVLVDETILAAQDLTTAARLTWWRTHLIPSRGIKYYNVSATMADSDRNLIINGVVLRPNEQAKLLTRFSYNTDSVDFSKLLGSYNSLKGLGDLINNDSQVSLHKSIFHPKLAPILNPQQQEFQSEVLGLFHTHHWGLTLKTVTQIQASGLNDTEEPFPRKSLLEAMITALASDPGYPLEKLSDKTSVYYKSSGR
jgi:hypothetical protein